MLDLPPLIDRRRFMQLMAAALALAEGGCVRSPPEPIVPYAEPPEGLTAGEPLYFATALTQGGYAQGVLVESRMGRPTKIEGNAAHPASRGATGAIEQGRILELWDPARSRACERAGQIVAWETVRAHLEARARQWTATRGEGLRILRGATSSPTWQREERAFLERYPAARVHWHEAVDRDQVLEGARLAFGRAVEPRYHFGRARVVVALDANFLGDLPGHLAYARDFTTGRRPEGEAMSRLYAAECMPSLTGAYADHCLALPPAELEQLALRLWAQIRSPGVASEIPWLRLVLRDLAQYPGESLILAGDAQPPRVHAVANLLNLHLGNVGRGVEYIDPVCGGEHCSESLAALTNDMRAHRVETLLILDCNPVYTAPADLEFGQALQAVPETLHHGLYMDETAAGCTWHVPAAHELESWGDARAFDGTVTIQQPLIAPLYGGRPRLELLALIAGDGGRSAHEVVRSTWQERFATRFEDAWRKALRSGFVEASAAPAVSVSPAGELPPMPQPTAAGDSLPELLLRPDQNLWDGRYAPVSWLQELPKPLTQLTWDNAALMNAAQAASLEVTNGSLVELSVAERQLVAPVWIVPRHASNSITLHLGGGRTQAGPVGSGCGVNAYRLRLSGGLWHARVRVRKVPGERLLACVQQHHRMEGRETVRVAALPEYRQNPSFAQRDAERGQPSLYPPAPPAEYAWAMVIDLGSCIGCNACTIACQAENNIPTVGREEVLRGREMHWIRVDRYEEPTAAGARTDFQPVPCMQCEHAPCELVCPVEASVHDPEGINVQVYNRCVGTRFCSNNCPYKVRRFNFFQYASDEPSLNAQRNPEVTVRMRGVMEKCNYCLQRIVRARISADRDSRRVREGEVVTACQAVCPTQAIQFGDLKDLQSAVSRARESPRNYSLLGELNTRPRTTYLAKVINPATPEEHS